MAKLTHIDSKGNAKMVDVSKKEITNRIAVASGEIIMSEKCLKMIIEGKHVKGDVLSTARIAGIMASKNTSTLIPLCHNIPLSNVEVNFEPIKNGFKAISTVKCSYVTGVEMEALTAVSVALLTIYDMCKAVDKKMVIQNIHLLNKSGGKSGDFIF